MGKNTKKPICPYADTAANLELENPILVAGQKVFDLTNQQYKTGDGITPWNKLSFGEEKIDGGTY